MDKQEINHNADMLEALSSLAPGPSVEAEESAQDKRKKAVKAFSGKKAMTEVEHSMFDVLTGGANTWIDDDVWNNIACSVDTQPSLVFPEHLPLLRDECGWDDMDVQLPLGSDCISSYREGFTFLYTYSFTLKFNTRTESIIWDLCWHFKWRAKSYGIYFTFLQILVRAFW